MGPEVRHLINRTIALPLALKTIALDRKQFEKFYTSQPYLGLLEHLEERMKRDLQKGKEDLFKQHQVLLHKKSETTYQWSKKREFGELTFTSNELKELTTEMIRLYIQRTDGKMIPPYEKGWNVLDLDPPDISDLEES